MRIISLHGVWALKIRFRICHCKATHNLDSRRNSNPPIRQIKVVFRDRDKDRPQSTTKVYQLLALVCNRKHQANLFHLDRPGVALILIRMPKMFLPNTFLVVLKCHSH